MTDDDTADDDTADDEPAVLPVDGVLDLHSFFPAQVRDVVVDYLEACRDANLLEVRIIHGKGTGALRRTVHHALARLDYVRSFRLADLDGGSWGATLVDLMPPPPPTKE